MLLLGRLPVEVIMNIVVFLYYLHQIHDIQIHYQDSTVKRFHLVNILWLDSDGFVLIILAVKQGH